MAMNPKYLKCEVFDTEEEAKEFIRTWEGGQLTAIGEGKDNKFFVGLPNDFTEMTVESIKEVEKLMNLNVELAIETQYGRTWGQCH